MSAIDNPFLGDLREEFPYQQDYYISVEPSRNIYRQYGAIHQVPPDALRTAILRIDFHVTAWRHQRNETPLARCRVLCPSRVWRSHVGAGAQYTTRLAGTIDFSGQRKQHENVSTTRLASADVRG